MGTGWRPPAGQVGMDERDQVLPPAPPRPGAEQAEGQLGDVHRRDLPSGRRGQQRGASSPAGQVGHRAIRQVQGQPLIASGRGVKDGTKPAPYLASQRSRSG
jgi:hypothetical protein